MNFYIKTLKKYNDFKGRSNRKEYWYFVLFNLLISILLLVIDDNFKLIIDRDTGIGLLSTLYSLIVLLPGIAVSVRRLHDINKAGKWLFLIFIPIVGSLWLISTVY